MNKQLNIELHEDAVKRIKIDAILLGVPLAEYADTAFNSFLAKTISQRRVALAGRSRKKTVNTNGK